ncbi:MAG: MlaA family lipoprotein, partial [Thiomonas sp.]
KRDAPFIHLQLELQLDLQDRMNGIMRVGVNTVFGLGGLLDPATEMRLYKRPFLRSPRPAQCLDHRSRTCAGFSFSKSCLDCSFSID